MTVLNEKQELEKLAALLADKVKRGTRAKKKQPSPPIPDQAQFSAIDLSPRTIRIRAIIRIANSYNWHAAIIHFLEMKGVPYISDLTDPQLDDLLDRMKGYVDAAETGCSMPDSLPAY